jgi:flavin prenyltransferase
VRRFVVGVTGASGSLCARALLQALAVHPEVGRVHVVLSRFSLLTMRAELGTRAATEAAGLRALLGTGTSPPSRRGRPAGKVVLHRSSDMAAAISSGSYPTDGMVVIPCSGGTLAAIATGVSTNLIHRAAEVTLKERRPLVLAFRESPLSLAHIENMQRATVAGAIVFPLTPAFYHRPRTLQEIAVQFTARIFDLLRLPHHLGQRWGTTR